MHPGQRCGGRVEQDKKDGKAIRVNSTPTFLVNGIPVVGLPSSNVFDYRDYVAVARTQRR